MKLLLHVPSSNVMSKDLITHGEGDIDENAYVLDILNPEILIPA